MGSLRVAVAVAVAAVVVAVAVDGAAGREIGGWAFEEGAGVVKPRLAYSGELQRSLYGDDLRVLVGMPPVAGCCGRHIVVGFVCGQDSDPETYAYS